MKVPRLKVVGGAGEGAGERAKDSLARLPCKNCAVDVVPLLYWNRMHLQADCPLCGKYIKHVPQVTPWLELAPPKIIEVGLFEDVA